MSSNFILMAAVAAVFNTYPGVQPAADQVVTLMHFDGAVGKLPYNGGNFATKGNVAANNNYYVNDPVLFGTTSSQMASSRWWNAGLPSTKKLAGADFTLEMSMYIPDTIPLNARQAIFGSNGGTVGFNLYMAADRHVRCFGAGGGNFATTSGLITDNRWHHIALTRKNNVFTIWINGKPEATAPAWDSDTLSLLLGRYTDSNGVVVYNNGYLDEYRYCHGIAIYTEEFEPPTVPFTL